MLYLLLAACAFVLVWFARSWIFSERHPTPPAEPIDPTPGSGVPLPDTDDVETKPSNPKRRTP